MATRKSQQEIKLTPTQLRQKVQELEEKINKFNGYGYCYMCDTHKDKSKFYISTDPMITSGITPICKECARKIALRVDKNGDEHEPTKESCQQALMYLNKPFLNAVWDSSIQDCENLLAGKVKANVWMSYVRIIAMVNYIGLTYKDSDMFRERIVYDDEKSEEDIINEHNGMDTYDSFVKNKEDVIRLLSYDPFEKEEISDQPFLYSQLLGMLDSNEDSNEDMMRTSSAISVVRGFLQQSKIDDAVAKLMSDVKNLDRNSATIKSLQESKSKLTSVITKLAQDSCISLLFNKDAKKGENTWTGKIKKIKGLNLREGEVNGFDIGTCKGMRQVLEMSDSSIMKQLSLDESEWSDMVAEQRQMLVNTQNERDVYKEINRILLRENIDLRDFLKENSMLDESRLKDLRVLFSPFSELEKEHSHLEEVITDEQQQP